jgi:hypothetical protein
MQINIETMMVQAYVGNFFKTPKPFVSCTIAETTIQAPPIIPARIGI